MERVMYEVSPGYATDDLFEVFQVFCRSAARRRGIVIGAPSRDREPFIDTVFGDAYTPEWQEPSPRARRDSRAASAAPTRSRFSAAELVELATLATAIDSWSSSLRFADVRIWTFKAGRRRNMFVIVPCESLRLPVLP